MTDQTETNVDRRTVLLGAGTAAAAGVVATFGAGTAQRARHASTKSA